MMTKIAHSAFLKLSDRTTRKAKHCIAIAVFFLLSFISYAQDRAIIGKVVDEKGTGLLNANITGKGTGATVRSDIEGNFTITVPQRVTTLVITYIGYTTREIPANSSNVGTITLQYSPKNEDAIIVTGFTRVKRSEYAGAATTVTADKIRSTPIASFDQILQGRAPGLSVLSGSGQPGSAAAVVLRGPTSIIGSNSPLYILDGVPVEASVFQSINPNNFETIDVLKDAVSAAQYGSRGAAGVIVATTKRGSGGKSKINFLYQTGRKFKPQFNYQMMNSRELLKAQEDVGKFIPSSTAPGWVNSPVNPTFAAQTPAVQAQRLKTLDSLGNINNDWDNNFFREGQFSSYDLSLSGGQGRTRIFSGLGLYKEEAIIRRSDLKRITLQNNLDYADDKVSVTVSNTLGYAKRNFQQSTTSNNVFNPFLSSRITAPYITPRDANGNVSFNGTALNAYGPYLIDAMQKDGNYNDQTKATLGVNTNYRVINDVTLNAFGSLDYRETQGTTFANPLTLSVSNPTLNTNVRTQMGSITESTDRALQLNGRIGATYAKLFKEKHDVSISGFYEILQNFNKSFAVQAFQLDPRRPNTIAAAGTVNAVNAPNYYPGFSGGRSERTLQSVAFLGKYAYNSKYVLNVSYRQDGSSQLPEDNRWQGFYSVGATWNIGQESFLANSKSIDVLRIKASYGSSANADNFPYGYYGYQETYATGVYVGGPSGLTQTLFVSNPGNPGAQWEYTNTTNIGIDFGLFRNRIYGDIQLYNKVTQEAFATQTLSATGGFTTLNVNSAKVGNKGVEYNVNVDVVKNDNLRWTIGANGAYNKNEVLSLGSISNFELGTSRISVGLPLGTHYEVGWSGVDAATGKPLYLDINGKVTDQYIASNRTQNWGTFYAPWTGGITSALTYKGFDFSVLFSWQKGSTRVNNLEFFVENPAFLQQGFNQATSLDFWKTPGQQARVQSPLYQNNFTSKYIQDASFIRLRNLSLAYTLPRSIVSKIKVSNIRMFVVGQNLAVWTKWKGYDPEDDNNISLSEFPNPRAITAGIDITF